MSRATLIAAIDYADRGWYTFPIERATKRPLPGSHGFKDATLDIMTLTRWFQDTDHNIGLALQFSGLIAIDIDPRNGGTETFQKLEQKFGPLPRILWASSASGGEHILMRDPGGRPRGKMDSAGCGAGVDVKYNGYVLVEPSETDAGKYLWQAQGEPEDMPDAWRAVALHPEADASTVVNSDADIWAENSDPELDIIDAINLKNALAQLPPRKQGKSSTFRAIRTIFHNYGLSLTDGAKYLTEWNANCGAPHLPHELDRKIWNASQMEPNSDYGRRGCARVSLPTMVRVERASARDYIECTVAQNIEPVSITEMACDTPVVLAPQSEVAPKGPLTYAGALEQACQEIDKYKGQTNKTEDERPFFLSGQKLFEGADQPPAWLVKSLLLEGGIGIIGAEPKSAKTWLAASLALAVATGKPALGYEHYTTGGTAQNVAYFYTEDMRDAIKSRIRSLLNGMGLGIETISRTFHAQPRGRKIDVTSEMDLARIIASVRLIESTHGPLKLLVLDPLRNIHSGEEDKADSMTPVFENLKMIGTILNCTILVVHHARKTNQSGKTRGGQMLRGSSAVHGFVDSGLYLSDLVTAIGDEKTNGESTYSSTVESETKAGRSAGIFSIKLTIEDDPESRTAVNALWEVHKGKNKDSGGDPAKEHSRDTDINTVLDAMYVNERLGMQKSKTSTQKDIRVLTKMNQGKCSNALGSATEASLVEFVGPRGSQIYQLTEAGRKRAESRTHKGQEEIVPPPALLAK